MGSKGKQREAKRSKEKQRDARRSKEKQCEAKGSKGKEKQVEAKGSKSKIRDVIYTDVSRYTQTSIYIYRCIDIPIYACNACKHGKNK